MCITDVTQTSRRVLESGLCSPWGGSMSHPGPPSLQLLSLNVNGLRERQKRAALFAVLQAGPWHVIALQETHHATQAEAAHWCREGAGPTAHGMAHHFGLLAHQPAAAWPCCSRHVRVCQGSQPILQTPVADLLPLKAALVVAMLFFDSIVAVFFFFFFLGYREIVHPPSADEGTERTWFEPEQRPRKRVPKRSVHGKQSPQDASKMSWRQDDQP